MTETEEANPIYSTWDEKIKVYATRPESHETDTIKDMQLALMEKRLAEDGLLETLHNIKTACILQVEVEWETTKDKALSNATKRNAEVELRLSGDEEYTMRQRQQEAVHREIQRDQIELDFQKREFQRQNGNAAITIALDNIDSSLDELIDPLREIPALMKTMKIPIGR